MARSLYSKLALVLLALLGVVGILYTLLTIFTTRIYLQEVNQKLNRTLARNIVADQLLSNQGEVSPFALRELFHLLMVVNPSIEVYLLDQYGTIVAYSAPAEKIKRTTISLEPIHQFLGDRETFPILGDDPRDGTRRKVFSASPIPLQGPPTGYLYIVLGGEEYDSVVDMLQRSYILSLSVWAALAAFLVALLAGLVLFSMLTRRLSQLAAAMESFSASDFAAPVLLDQPPSMPDRPRDEIEQLRITFNRMVQRILDQVASLQQTDTLRRELVANVSHDLRTPLTSLHGYLETLLIKDRRLTTQEQRDFLDIALKQSERLRQLVAELFELCRLDSLETRMETERFSVAELVQDVCLKFRLTVEHKGITLRSALPDDLPPVLGDIGLIERVLENIIDNAIRHTPSGGTITVSIIRRPASVLIQIADTGHGIAAKDLPHIFDRFYRGEYDRSRGGGLGLAITKRILELHGSSIRAESTPNVGTIMAFELPAVGP